MTITPRKTGSVPERTATLCRGAAVAALAALGLAIGCSAPRIAPPAGEAAGLAAARSPASAVAPIVGRVRFDGLRAGTGTRVDERYSTQATIGDDVAPGATVSLIDPATGFTLAGAVTDASGRFVLTFGDHFVPGDQPYILCSLKSQPLG